MWLSPGSDAYYESVRWISMGEDLKEVPFLRLKEGYCLPLNYLRTQKFKFPSFPYECNGPCQFLHEADMTTHFYLPEDQARIARYLNSYNRWYLNPPAMVMDENPNWQKIDDSQIQLQFTSNGAQRNVRLHQHTVSLYPLDSDCDPP